MEATVSERSKDNGIRKERHGWFFEAEAREPGLVLVDNDAQEEVRSQRDRQHEGAKARSVQFALRKTSPEQQDQTSINWYIKSSEVKGANLHIKNHEPDTVSCAGEPRAPAWRDHGAGRG
jgi:hypothetical protein